MFFRYNALFRRARALRLSPEEKTAQKAELLAFMAVHPVRVPMPVRQVWYRSNMRLVPAMLALLVIVVGAGTVSAAERALPTEFLYPVKIHVTEPVRRQLARTPEAKAELDATLAIRRLDEARRLAAAGELTTSTQVEITERFETQAGRVDASLKTLRKEGKPERAERVADRLERAVERQREAVEEDSRPTTRTTETLLPVLTEAKQRVKQLREEERRERKDDRQHDRRDDRREETVDEPTPSREHRPRPEPRDHESERSRRRPRSSGDGPLSSND